MVDAIAAARCDRFGGDEQTHEWRMVREEGRTWSDLLDLVQFYCAHCLAVAWVDEDAPEVWTVSRVPVVAVAG